MASIGEKIKTMIEQAFATAQITSAGGTSPLINEVISVDVTAIDVSLGDELPQELTKSKDGKKITDAADTVGEYELGNVGDVQKFTAKQFGNIKSFALNPFGFIIGALIGKFAKGAGVAALALVLFTVVQFIIDELMKPGRALDRRFRRLASEELLIFTARQEQEELRFGIKQVIITTRPLLRGGKGQFGTNFFGHQPNIRPEVYEARIPKQEVKLALRGQGKSGRNVGGFRRN